MSDLSIRNPVFAVMLAAAMIVFGFMGYRGMGVSQFPEIDFPVVSVLVTLEQASPDVIDGDVTEVIEDTVSGVEGVDYVMSQSFQGASLVTVFFRLDRKIDVAMQDIQNAVAASRRKLPREVDPPIIQKVNPNNLPVMWLTLSSPNVPLSKVSDFADKELKPILSALPDVGGVQFSGLRARNVRIWLDSGRMQANNLTASDVQEAIQKQHVELPAGYINSSRVELNVRTMGEIYNVAEFKQILVAQKGNQAVYLGDIATIEDGAEDYRSLARYNRLPTVAIGVRKAIGGNLVTVCDNVRKELPKIKRALPEGVEISVPVDYSLFVRENIDEMKLTLVLGVVLTAIVCFLFLGSIGTTVNICLSIPTSLIGTFVVINYGVQLLGMPPFTINLMTLLALSLSVGVVVDDAILVLENIYRHREMGKSRVEAAIQGSREISFAAVAATLSIMAIFLPVAFMSGTIGRFFFQFGVTVGVAVLLSLVSALTLTPMLCAFFLNVRHAGVTQKLRANKPELGIVVGILLTLSMSAMRVAGRYVPLLDGWGWPQRGFETPTGGSASWWAIAVGSEIIVGFALAVWGGVLYALFDRWVLNPLLLHPIDWLIRLTTKVYTILLRWSLRRKSVVLAASAVLMLIAGAFLWFDLLGQELIPSEDQSRFVVHVVCPVGSSIDQVDLLLRDVESLLVKRPEIAGILTSVGSEVGAQINEADLFISLTPVLTRDKSQKQLMREIRAELEAIEDIRVVIRDQSLEGFTAQRGDPIDFTLTGPWEELPHVAAEILERMEKTRRMQDIDSNYRPGMPEEQIVPNREKLALLNVPVSRVADSMSLLIGGQRVARFTDKNRRYDVRLRLTEGQRSSPENIDPLTVRAGNNQQVPLSDVVTRQTVSTVPVIHRFRHQRTIEITASPAEGVSQGEAIAEARKIAEEVLAEHAKEGNFEIVDLGNAQAMRDTIRSLVFALILGILIAYMILGVQFNSFIHPLTVLMALPFAVTGAFVSLYLTGDTLNMMSLIGLILLMGLVKKNSIILVDYTRQLQREGQGLEESVMNACPVRLRPILMTSLATIMGGVPAALGYGPGAETRAPMARAIIGGILLSTLVTLFLVPVFYVLMEKLRTGGIKRLLRAPEPTTNAG